MDAVIIASQMIVYSLSLSLSLSDAGNCWGSDWFSKNGGSLTDAHIMALCGLCGLFLAAVRPLTKDGIVHSR